MGDGGVGDGGVGLGGVGDGGLPPKSPAFHSVGDIGRVVFIVVVVEIGNGGCS